MPTTTAPGVDWSTVGAGGGSGGGTGGGSNRDRQQTNQQVGQRMSVSQSVSIHRSRDCDTARSAERSAVHNEPTVVTKSLRNNERHLSYIITNYCPSDIIPLKV
jgi:hypothetical protein